MYREPSGSGTASSWPACAAAIVIIIIGEADGGPRADATARWESTSGAPAGHGMASVLGVKRTEDGMNGSVGGSQSLLRFLSDAARTSSSSGVPPGAKAACF
eukprot:COSAG01_NODE_411_length_17360_cov_11.401852_21_plen_102_part_00